MSSLGQQNRKEGQLVMFLSIYTQQHRQVTPKCVLQATPNYDEICHSGLKAILVQETEAERAGPGRQSSWFCSGNTKAA